MRQTLAHLVPVVLGLATPILARQIPSNIIQLRDKIIKAKGCSHPLGDKGFIDSDDEPTPAFYCADEPGIIYLTTPGGRGGNLANMDIDCDGDQSEDRKGNDGRCPIIHSTPQDDDTQAETAFGDEAKQYGIPELNPYVHGYVAFGNTADPDKPQWPQFDPVVAGVRSLSVMVVVCGDKMFYGLFGDINGSDGENAVVGEASIGLATACFGKSMTNNNGHDEDDVLYIAFTGDGTKPEGTARWDADTFEQFEQSLAGLGDRLVSKIKP